MATTVTRKKVYRVPAGHRPTYDQLAALCGLHGPVRHAEALTAYDVAYGYGPVPTAFTVLSADEWIIWTHTEFPSQDGVQTMSHADVKAWLNPTPEAKPARTTKAQLMKALNAHRGSLPAEVLALLEAA